MLLKAILLDCDEILLDRVTTRLRLDPETGCLLWTGYKNTKGYGIIWVHGKQCKVHRLAYTLCVGPIAPKMTIDHLCRVRHCVNPSHLEVVTARENVLRGDGPTAINARTTHCKWGHPFDETNTLYWGAEGTKSHRRRVCRQCRKIINELRRKQRVQ